VSDQAEIQDELRKIREAMRAQEALRGILPDAAVTVVSVEWHGSDALTLVYRGPNGRVADEILYRHDEARLEIVEAGRPWSFDGDGALFRLMPETLACNGVVQSWPEIPSRP